jgi:8-oxo-dGTP pyrophosphatase MutT (NUDIX family)
MTARPPRLSAGVVVVRETSDGWRFLLLRAFNHWDFPKGMVERGEDPQAAAVREVREESLIDDLKFAWGHASTSTGPYSRGKVAEYFVPSTPSTGGWTSTRRCGWCHRESGRSCSGRPR